MPGARGQVSASAREDTGTAPPPARELALKPLPLSCPAARVTWPLSLRDGQRVGAEVASANVSDRRTPRPQQEGREEAGGAERARGPGHRRCTCVHGRVAACLSFHPHLSFQPLRARSPACSRRGPHSLVGKLRQARRGERYAEDGPATPRAEGAQGAGLRVPQELRLKEPSSALPSQVGGRWLPGGLGVAEAPAFSGGGGRPCGGLCCLQTRPCRPWALKPKS